MPAGLACYFRGGFSRFNVVLYPDVKGRRDLVGGVYSESIIQMFT